MAEFVKFQVPEDLVTLQKDVLSKISKSGKIKIGINEVTKVIERNTAKLVLIAEDVAPVEIIMHVPILCKEKKVPFSYVKTREELGKISGISAKASSIAIMDEGVAKKEFSSLLTKISEISGDKPKPVPVKEDKKEKVKEKPKEETKAEEVKEKPKEETKAEEVKEKPKEEAKEE
jgi:large subunit ribosomal protein L7Ae